MVASRASGSIGVFSSMLISSCVLFRRDEMLGRVGLR